MLRSPHRIPPAGSMNRQFVRTVGIVEHQIRRVDRPQVAVVDEILYLGDAVHEAIGEIDAEQAVAPPGSRYYVGGLRCGPPERLLAEHRNTTLQGCSRLVGMECTGCGNDETVQPSIEHMIQGFVRTALPDLRGSRSVLRYPIANCHDIDQTALSQCFHA